MANATPENIDKRFRTLERAAKRERAARQQAETLLETKSRELYLANKDLTEQHEKLKRRNSEIESARNSLAAIHNELKNSYATTIEVFARLIQSRSGLGARVSVAEDARELGKKSGLSEEQCTALYNAALLCDVGKLSLSDDSVQIPYTRLDVNAHREYHRHPVVAEATLLSIEPLEASASIIRHHCERVDGTGFPDKMSADEIPLPARILAVAKAYSDLKDGRLVDEKMTSAEAKEFIISEKGKRYDKAIVDLFVDWLDNRNRAPEDTPERKQTLNAVRVGSKVARDLCDTKGVLILGKGQIVSKSMLDKLAQLQSSLGESLVVYTRET